MTKRFVNGIIFFQLESTVLKNALQLMKLIAVINRFIFKKPQAFFSPC